MIFRAGGHRSFTFIELIFIAVILSILAAVSIPQFRKSFNLLAVQNFISDFTAIAGYAQAKAVNGGSEVRIRLDLPKKLLLTENHFIIQDSYGVTKEEWRIEKVKNIPDSVSIDLKKTGDRIVFYPDGTSDNAQLEISDGYGRKYSVSMEPGTGYVTVKQMQ